MSQRRHFRINKFFLLLAGWHATPALATGVESLFKLDLQQLSNTTVSSVSNTDEVLRDAPSTTIVLTREQLITRGYRNLSQMFDDLPGMDVVRPYGDVYYANYWRGIRNNLGSPFLLLLDGIAQNDLYYNSTEMLVTFPINAIERVEVVYGPASVVYGANAFAGVVNIITRHASPEKGVHSSGEIRSGSFSTRIADVFATASNGRQFATVAARYDTGLLDDSMVDSYEWTRNDYYADPSLWGGFSNHSDYGQFHSAHRNTAVDVRMGQSDTLIAAQQMILNSGYGTEYPADRVQNQATWREKAEMVYLQQRERFSSQVNGKTLLAYRFSGLDKPSDFLDAFNGETAEGPVRLLRYSYWDIGNSSTLISQDLEWHVSESLRLNGGVKAEWKDLQRAANVAYGAVTPADQAVPPGYDYPGYPSQNVIANNNVDTTDKSLYTLATWRLPVNFWGSTQQLLNAGARVDNNSIFGSETSARGGWVGHFGDFTYKIMALGDAYQPPTPRVMFSGWEGSGSDPDLTPETARTHEISAEYIQPNYHLLLSGYHMHSKDAIINFPSGAANAGEVAINGADFHASWRLVRGSGEWLRWWMYYSYLEVEGRVDSNEEALYSPIGDTSAHKLHAGLRWPLSDNWETTWRARYYGDRDTVATNPVDRVKSWATADASVIYRLDTEETLRWILSIENLFNRRYFHPGIRQADAGIEPGAFADNGVWQGSEGYFNSLLPQEGRGLFLSLQWDR